MPGRLVQHFSRNHLQKPWGKYPSDVTIIPLQRALQNVYPEHEWMLWRFNIVPIGCWQNEKYRKDFFDWLGKHSSYTDMDDWYNITADNIYRNGGGMLLQRYYDNSLLIAVQTVFP